MYCIFICCCFLASAYFMQNFFSKHKPLAKFKLLPLWLRNFLKGLFILLALIVAGYTGMAWYINTHKQEVLSGVTDAFNENITGSLTIGNMEPTFLMGFPHVSLRLQDVTLRDSLYATHGHTLLRAQHIDLSVNALALLGGTIDIKKITIANAEADLFTDATGYSNTSVFKPGKAGQGNSEGSLPQLRRLGLKNVRLAIDNRKMGKLHSFTVKNIDGTLRYTDYGWKARVKLETVVHSLAFSTRKGSFIKDKQVEGNFDIVYRETSGVLTCTKNRLRIGGEDFTVAAQFKTKGPKAEFHFNIENEAILWGNAARLLSPNITRKLDMFDIKEPIAVKCDIVGDFNVKGDPLIRVNAEVKDNLLNTPGGEVADCNFFGVFTNEHVKGKGYNDANSAIKLYNFKGSYGTIPFTINKIFILDLEKPIATGNFRSQFEMARLGNLIDDDLLKFKEGTAEVNLNFRADIENFKIARPLVTGTVKVAGASLAYVPRKLDFNNISVALNFTEDDLYIGKINLKTEKSVVNMDGNIKNFLNLYYTAPEKIVLNWNIYSPQLHLGEFMGFLGSRGKGKKTVTGSSKGNFTRDLDLLFEKSNVNIALKVDNIYYKNFKAADAHAWVILADNTIVVKNAGLRHSGGYVAAGGTLTQGNLTRYAINTKITSVDVRQFFSAFDNFGLESLQSGNLAGKLSATASISGSLTASGALVPRTMYGNVSFGLKKGALLKFDPVRNVGKFAFPFRNMDSITFRSLNGRFDIKGEKVTIHPMQVNSSVLNMDVSGIYSFGKGTNIAVAVPLRNPKRDKGITDTDELARRRNRGIVLHLLAVDDEETGKVKIKLGKRE